MTTASFGGNLPPTELERYVKDNSSIGWQIGKQKGSDWYAVTRFDVGSGCSLAIWPTSASNYRDWAMSCVGSGTAQLARAHGTLREVREEVEFVIRTLSCAEELRDITTGWMARDQALELRPRQIELLLGALGLPRNSSRPVALERLLRACGHNIRVYEDLCR